MFGSCAVSDYKYIKKISKHWGVSVLTHDTKRALCVHTLQVVYNKSVLELAALVTTVIKV